VGRPDRQDDSAAALSGAGQAQPGTWRAVRRPPVTL